MAAPRFFVSIACASGMELELEPDDAHHAAHVLRLQAKDRIVIIDRLGAWDAAITTVVKGKVRARIADRSAEAGGELSIKITVLQALIKGAKFDAVVEKCVELGAQRIVPMKCERSYADATPARLERWRRIARAAAQQSRRQVVPIVADAESWHEAIERATSPMLVAWEGAMPGSFAQCMRAAGDSRSFTIAVGPEGSFTEGEISAARDAGCAMVSLGPTILRTETAASALIAAIASRDW